MNQKTFKNNDELSEAIFEKITKIYGENARRFFPLIDIVKTLKGANIFFKEALLFNNDRIPDFIVELLFTAYFYKEGYTTEIIPRSNGQKTPDLLISKIDFRGFVEIKHIHKKHEGPSVVNLNEFSEFDLLELYGDSVRDEKYCRDKILEGFQQIHQFSWLNNTDAMVVAIWNSDEDLDDHDINFSITHLIEENNEFKNVLNPKWIVYGSDWYSCRKQTQFHVFRF